VTAEVDWGEATVSVAGALMVLGLCLMRSCFSGACFVMAFETQCRQAFFEGHVHALEWFSGVFSTIRYDNLAAAAKKTLKGRNRVENERFPALRSYYLYESWFTLVGIESSCFPASSRPVPSRDRCGELRGGQAKDYEDQLPKHGLLPDAHAAQGHRVRKLELPQARRGRGCAINYVQRDHLEYRGGDGQAGVQGLVRHGHQPRDSQLDRPVHERHRGDGQRSGDNYRRDRC